MYEEALNLFGVAAILGVLFYGAAKITRAVLDN